MNDHGRVTQFREILQKLRNLGIRLPAEEMLNYSSVDVFAISWISVGRKIYLQVPVEHNGVMAIVKYSVGSESVRDADMLCVRLKEDGEGSLSDKYLFNQIQSETQLDVVFIQANGNLTESYTGVSDNLVKSSGNGFGPPLVDLTWDDGAVTTLGGLFNALVDRD